MPISATEQSKAVYQSKDRNQDKKRQHCISRPDPIMRQLTSWNIVTKHSRIDRLSGKIISEDGCRDLSYRRRLPVSLGDAHEGISVLLLLVCEWSNSAVEILRSEATSSRKSGGNG